MKFLFLKNTYYIHHLLNQCLLPSILDILETWTLCQFMDEEIQLDTYSILALPAILLLSQHVDLVEHLILKQ